MQVLTIAMHRPASLTAFFRQQQSKTQSEADVSLPMHEMAGLLVQALPWVLHSLKAHTSNPHFPPSFLRWLAQACIAAVISCAEAAVGMATPSGLIFLQCIDGVLAVHMVDGAYASPDLCHNVRPHMHGVGTVEDSAGAASPEGMSAVYAMAADLLLCPIKDVSEAAAAELTQALLTRLNSTLLPCYYDALIDAKTPCSATSVLFMHPPPMQQTSR